MSRSRTSVPNIFTVAPRFSQDYFKKRHSFQEGVKYFQEKVRSILYTSVLWNRKSPFQPLQFPDLSLDSDRSYPQSLARRNRGLDWWPAESQNMFSPGATDGLKIFVSCEDTADPPEDDQLDVGLESLCLAVTEQALD